MRSSQWRALSYVNWKHEAPRQYLDYNTFKKLADELWQSGHLATTFNKRSEWKIEGTFKHEVRGYWEHLYIGGPKGVKHYVSNRIDNTQNYEAMKLGFIPDTGRRANTIEQKIFKELNGVTERQAFGYSEPQLNKCVPKQLYYINSRWINKKITCAGKADFSSHYPANMCGPLPDWSRVRRVDGTVDPTPEYPFVFYTRSGHLAEYKRFNTHYWREEELTGDLFGSNYSKVDPDHDVSMCCPSARYSLDSTIELLYNKKTAGEEIDGLPAKSILVSSIGYKHLKSPLNTRNRLYHLAAVCIARANQKMIDLFAPNARSVLQIIVDCIIYMGPHELGEHRKALGVLHQEITDNSFIMRGVNQYMFINRNTGECTCSAHSGFDFNLLTTKLEDILVWQRSPKE